MSSLTLDMLHRAYAGPSAAKAMARDARVSHRTSEKWWARLTTPRSDVLWRMCRENARLRAEMMLALQGDAYAGLVDRVGVDCPASGGAVAQSGGADGGTLAAVAVRGRS